MICVKFTAFCDFRADLRICLATLRKSVRKFWFCKLALTCVDLRVRLARALDSQVTQAEREDSTRVMQRTHARAAQMAGNTYLTLAAVLTCASSSSKFRTCGYWEREEKRYCNDNNSYDDDRQTQVKIY